MTQPAEVANQRKMISDPVDLEVPIKRGEQLIGTVQLRRPQGGELRGLNLHDILKLDITAMHDLLPRITMPPLTRFEVQALDPADLVQLSAEITDFFVPAGMKSPA